jgi:hypothetical protein
MSLATIPCHPPSANRTRVNEWVQEAQTDMVKAFYRLYRT